MIREKVKKGLVYVLLTLIAACATTKAPVDDASARQGYYNSDGMFEYAPTQGEVLNDAKVQTDVEIASAELNNSTAIDRSAPPVIGKLLYQSKQAAAQQDWVKAESYLQRALRISPKNALLWHKMASVKLQQGKYGQAAQFASKSNAISPDVRLHRVNEEIITAAREQ